MQIYKKMAAILSEIGSVQKSQKNSMQGYSFRGIDQFLNSLHPILAKHEVFISPRCTFYDSELKDVIRSNGKASVDKYVSMKIEYDFIASDGSKVTIGPIPSEGMDSSDKATNKALSAALKYALIQTFAVPTEDMEEADRDTPEISPVIKPKLDTPKTIKTVSDAQIKRLMSIVTHSKWDAAEVKLLIKERYNKTSSKLLNEEEYLNLCDYIVKHPIINMTKTFDEEDIPLTLGGSTDENKSIFRNI